MIYKDFQGKKLSALGMGAMRLPVIDGDDTKVDNDKVKEMVAYAMEKGVITTTPRGGITAAIRSWRWARR